MDEDADGPWVVRWGQLLRGLLLQAFFSVRSERQLMEQLDYNLLFRWFIGLGIDDPVRDVTVFTKNRDRLLAGEIAARFFAAILDDPGEGAFSRTNTSRSMVR
jgi:Transposase domain (DUF772)